MTDEENDILIILGEYVEDRLFATSREGRLHACTHMYGKLEGTILIIMLVVTMCGSAGTLQTAVSYWSCCIAEPEVAFDKFSSFSLVIELFIKSTVAADSGRSFVQK